MYYPWDIERFRAAIDDGVKDRFEGVPFTSAQVRTTSARGEVVEPEETRRLTPPRNVFGTPADESCLSGIGAWDFVCPAKQLHRVRQGTVIGVSSLLGQDGSLYCPDLVTSADALIQAGSARVNHGQAHVLRHDAPDAATVFYYWVGTPRQLNGTALFLPNPEPGNYGSFLIRVLPPLMLASRLRLTFDLVITADRPHWLLEAFRLLDISPRPILLAEEVFGTVVRDVLLFNDFSVEGFFSSATARDFRALSARLAQSAERGPAAPLYISRSLALMRTPRYRRLQNELAIEDRLRAHGWQIAYPEALSFSDQIRLFAQASHIAGPSGSGMLNAVFAPDRARVLDMESFHVTVRQHAKVYASTDKEYSFAFGRLNDADDRDQTTRDWEMPDDVLKSGIDWLSSNR